MNIQSSIKQKMIVLIIAPLALASMVLAMENINSEIPSALSSLAQKHIKPGNKIEVTILSDADEYIQLKQAAIQLLINPNIEQSDLRLISECVDQLISVTPDIDRFWEMIIVSCLIYKDMEKAEECLKYFAKEHNITISNGGENLRQVLRLIAQQAIKDNPNDNRAREFKLLIERELNNSKIAGKIRSRHEAENRRNDMFCGYQKDNTWINF